MTLTKKTELRNKLLIAIYKELKEENYNWLEKLFGLTRKEIEEIVKND